MKSIVVTFWVHENLYTKPWSILKPAQYSFPACHNCPIIVPSSRNVWVLSIDETFNSSNKNQNELCTIPHSVGCATIAPLTFSHLQMKMCSSCNSKYRWNVAKNSPAMPSLKKWWRMCMVPPGPSVSRCRNPYILVIGKLCCLPSRLHSHMYWKILL